MDESKPLEEIRTRTSTLVRHRPIRGEGQRDFLGESEGSPPPPPHDSLPVASEAINDFWCFFFSGKDHERKVRCKHRLAQEGAQLTRETGRPRPRRRSMAPRHQHPNRHGAPTVTLRTPAQHNMTMLCTNV